MPSFFKDLRRRSTSARSSSATLLTLTVVNPKRREKEKGPISEKDEEEEAEKEEKENKIRTQSRNHNDSHLAQSSSSVDSTVGSATPPTSVSLPSDRSNTDLKSINLNFNVVAAASPGPSRCPSTINLQKRPRPLSQSLQSLQESQPQPRTNRYSLSSTLSPIAPRPHPHPAASPFTPRILSISDNSWVHQKVLLIYGHAGDTLSKPLDGSLTLHHHLDTFPPTTWPVCDSHFKALVHLQPGPNKLRIDFCPQRSPKEPHSSSSVHSSCFSINYLPLNNTPPLHLAILLAKDSPATFDAVPQRMLAEGNGLDTAVRKFRMAAYLWQAFTGEQMSRAGFGRRCFRYEEEWTEGSLSVSDRAHGRMRNEAKIHVIRMDKTLAELRDQHGSATCRADDLYAWASDAVVAHFGPRPGQKLFVSCMYLDSHWDPELQTVTAHAALGAANDPVHLAVFGSHALQSYPSAIEEVVPALSDCTRTDTAHVANDGGESGSSWEAANMGIGAHLRATGHALGCPQQQHGVMQRDYVRLSRTFTCREPYATRTHSPGRRLTLQADECAWHRLDVLRFRFHPAFRLPTDPVLGDGSVQVWVVDNGTVLATATTGIAFIEIFADADDVCRAWLEFVVDVAGPGSVLPKQLPLIESELRAKLPAHKQKGRLRVVIHSGGQGRRVVDDFAALVAKDARVKLPNGRTGFRGAKLGASLQRPSDELEMFVGSNAAGKSSLLLAVKVYSGGDALDGIEFCFDDKTSRLFGSRGHGDGCVSGSFELDTRMGETVLGFYVRAGAWVDGLQILTSSGRRSEVFGSATRGCGGYSIAGLYGTCGRRIDGLGVIISR